MKKEIIATVLPFLLFANIAEASAFSPETDATLCYMRWPGLIDLSYTLCGVRRSSPSSTYIPFVLPTIPNPVKYNPFVYNGPLGPGATVISPLGSGGISPSSGGDTACQNSWNRDSRGRLCGNRAADRRPGGR